MSLEGKNRTPKGLTFNPALEINVLSGHNVAADTSVDTVVAALPLAMNEKVIRVSCTAQAISGHPRLQFTLGSGVPGGVGDTDTIATNGISVFTAPVTLTCNNFNGQTIAPGNWDVIYPAGGVLTVRTLTTAADTVTALSVNIGLTPQDGKPTAPLLHALSPEDF